MAYDYSELLSQARQWAAMAQAEGRLSVELGHLLDTIDARSEETLFAASQNDPGVRPLIVAFMGGTGVGKSSLLNRLAGQPIARAGVERPTSREVTLYHHQSLAVNKLPASLPLESIKLSRHNDSANSHIVWIDMPDFDSVELDNKRMVLEWLPHIDVLLYVVSPERYRDNKAWQLLLAEGNKHAWLFVMNQWDRGQAVQYDDFKQQLAKAGFNQPVILKTSCTEPVGDEFDQLLEQLKQLSGRHSVAQLEQRNAQLRQQQLQQTLQLFADSFSQQAHAQLQQHFPALWQHTEMQLQQGLAWPMLQLAQFWAENLGQASEISLWDEWAQNRLNDLLDELVLQAEQANIPTKPLKTALESIRAHTEQNLIAQTELAGRQALLKPGNDAQRFLLQVTAIGETLLPLTAMGVVGYQVFSGYYHSATDASAYLGTDFAVHSVLLIGLSWLIPFFLHKKIQPSLQKAALKGLQKGLQQALATVMAEIKQVMLSEQQRNEVLRQQLARMIDQCGAYTPIPLEKDSLLSRVLLETDNI